MSNYTSNPDLETDVPQEVKDFLKDFSDAVVDRDVVAAEAVYEGKYHELESKFYKSKKNKFQKQEAAKSWPDLSLVRDYAFKGAAPVVESLYKFMTFCTAYSKLDIHVKIRNKSWENYGDIFSRLLDMTPESKHVVDLPNGLSWDLLNEFIFQLQTQYNRKVKPANEGMIAPGSWTIAGVSAKLDEIISRTNILKTLAKFNDGSKKPVEFFESKKGADAASSVDRVHRVLGLFALIAQAQLSVHLGDYVGALSVLEPLALFTTGKLITQHVAPAHVALFYSVGFCYVMMRRYADAVVALKHALGVKAVNRPYVDHMQAQVVSLLTLSTTLGGLQAEDFSQFLAERNRQFHEDDILLLSQGDVDRFRDVFYKSIPKFISINDGSTEFTGTEGRDLQTGCFMRSVRHQMDALKLRGYLKSYSIIDNAKIGVLLTQGQSTTGSVGPLAHLISLKSRFIELVHDYESPNLLTGSEKSVSMIDFVVDLKNVHVVHRKERISVAKRFINLLQALQ
jgi:translation initiation factor 3 subunit L